jgi:GPH family glycoside/pentoside/hexuronide:cation symporter
MRQLQPCQVCLTNQERHNDMNDAAAAGSHARLSIPIRFGWGIGSLGMSLMFNATGLLMLRYLVDHVGLGAALAGLLIGAAKVYDAVTDPLMGTISDRTRTRSGRRRPYLLLGAALSAISFAMIFNLAGFRDSDYLVMLVVLVLLLNATGYTIFNVPYMAMPAEMTRDYHERTSLMSFRVASVAGGQLVASFLGPLLLVAYGGAASGHAAMALWLAAVIFAAGALSFWMTRDAPFQEQLSPPAAISIHEQFKTAMQNRPFMILLGVKLTQLLGLAIFIAVLPFLFTRVLKVSDAFLGLYFLLQGSLMLVSQPVWVHISRRLGKRAGFVLAAAIYSAAGLSWLLAVESEPVAGILARGAVAGFGAGGLLLVGQAMLPDTMEHDFQLSGVRREGVLSGVYTTVEKVSFALGPALTGLLLGAAGYIRSADAAVQQPEAARLVIYLCASVIPALVLACGCLLLLGYDLTETRLKNTPARV